MFIRNGIYHRMIYAVKLAAILSIAGSVIRTADDKGTAPLLLPPLEQPPQFLVRIPQRGSMAQDAVTGCPLQVEIIGIMNCIHIQIHKNTFFCICNGNFL